MSPLLADLIVPPDATVLDAIRRIDAGCQIALVVDEAGRLAGTVTDGDVRRGILRGLPLSAPVSAVMTASPRTAPAGTPDAEVLRVMRTLEIHQIPLVDAEGRLTGIRTLDTLLQRHQPNLVVLMAGGLGLRLRPLTDALPKPMLPIGGRPILETILESFINQGFKRFCISVNYHGHIIRDHFGDGLKWGAEITYLEEGDRMGTAGSLSLIPERPEHPVIVMNGDILTAVNFQQLLAFHTRNAAAATMAVQEHTLKVPYGVVQVENARLIGIQEKPAHRFFINAGIYALNPEVLARIPTDAPYDMPTLFQDLLAAGERTVAFPVHEYWLDIGQPGDLKRAEDEFPTVFG